LYNLDDFIKLIKKTALEAVVASKPANMVFGNVISTNPLKIKVDQKLILTSAQLTLSRNVTDYRLSVTVDHTTESASGGSGDSAFASHNHAIKGKKEITVHNALKNGETVILMQVSGGQKYIVIDRIGKGEGE
jgi:hypothetical protein